MTTTRKTGVGVYSWGVLSAMFPCFSFFFAGLWCLEYFWWVSFLFVSESKTGSMGVTATSYYITSNRLGLHGGSKPREHWDIGVFLLYASRAWERARLSCRLAFSLRIFLFWNQDIPFFSSLAELLWSHCASWCVMPWFGLELSPILYRIFYVAFA